VLRQADHLDGNGRATWWPAIGEQDPMTSQNVAYVTPAVIPRQTVEGPPRIVEDQTDVRTTGRPDDAAVIDLIEHAAAVATVGALGVDAIWIAPTHEGAELRASLCLARRVAPADVVAALERWSA
jgi:hypothetical protein